MSFDAMKDQAFVLWYGTALVITSQYAGQYSRSFDIEKGKRGKKKKNPSGMIEHFLLCNDIHLPEALFMYLWSKEPTIAALLFYNLSAKKKVDSVCV